MNEQHFLQSPGEGAAASPTIASHSPGFILIGVTHSALRAEAAHIVAAAGMEAVAVDDPREIASFLPRASAVIVDKHTALHVASMGRGERQPADLRQPAYFVAGDSEEIDFEAAMKGHATQAYLLPAEAEELLKEVGRLSAWSDNAGSSPAFGASWCGGSAATADVDSPAQTTVKPERAGVIAVIGACGGVGTSTFAAALARSAVRTGNAGATVVDGTDGSGGLDLLLGIESSPGARWPDLKIARDGEGSADIGAAELRAALPATADGITVLSAARASGAVADSFRLEESALSAVTKSLATAPGFTVVDLPPLDPSRVGALLPSACHHAVVITPCEVRPTARAAQLIGQLHAHRVPTILVVRHRQWSGMEVTDVEELTRTDATAVLPHIRRLPKQVETAGLPQRLPRGLHSAAQRVLESVGWAA